MTIDRKLEHDGPLGRKLTIHISAETMQQAKSDILRDIGNRVQLPGFRKGKIPATVLQREYGKRAEQESMEKMVQRTLTDAMREEELRPVAIPQIKMMQDEQSDGLSYCASFEVFPQIQFAAASELEVQRPVCKVMDEDVESSIQNIREKYPDETLVERQARMGDIVECDLVVLAGQGQQSGKAVLQKIALEDKLEPEVKDFLAGSEVGKSGTVTIHHAGEGNGQQLNITVKAVYETSLPQLDKDFFARMNVADIEGLRAEVKRALENEARHMEPLLLWKRVCAALCAKHNDIDLPQQLVQQERERLQQEGIPPEQVERDAGNMVREHILLELYVSTNQLEPSPQEVRRLVERAASGHKNPKAYIDWHYADSNRLSRYRWAALRNNVLTQMSREGNFPAQNLSFAELARESV